MKLDLNSIRKLINYLLILGFILCPMLVYMSMKRFLNIYESIGFYLSHEYYEHLYEDNSYRSIAKEAKSYIPRGSKVSYSQPGRGRAVKFVNYELPFEYKITEDWDFYIDFGNRIKTDDDLLKVMLVEGKGNEIISKVKSFRLKNSQIRLFYKDGAPLIENPEKEQIINTFPALVIFLLILIWKVLVGFSVFSRVSKGEHSTFSLGLTIANCLTIGILAFYIPLTLMLVANIQLTRFSILALWGGISIVLFYTCRKHMQGYVNMLRNDINWKITYPKSFIQWMITIAGAYYVFAVLVQAAVSAPYLWDAFSFWLLKAKIIFLTKGVYYGGTNYNNYPILWPLIISTHYALFGSIFEYVAKWYIALFIFLTVLLMKGVFQYYGFKPYQAWGLLGVFLAYLLSPYMLGAYAEMVYVYYYTVLIVSSIFIIKGYKLAELLWFLGALGLALIKREGYVGVLVVGTSFLYVIIFVSSPIYDNKSEKNKLLIRMIIYIVFSVGCYLLWVYFQSIIGNITRERSVLRFITLEKVMKMPLAAYYAMHKADPSRVFFFGSLTTLCVLMFKKIITKNDLSFMLCTNVGMLLFVMVAQLQFGEIRMGEIISRALRVSPRLFSHLIPSLFIMEAILIKDLMADRWNLNQVTKCE